MVHRDGSIRWFLARGIGDPRRARHGGRMAGTDTDITERKRSEEALRQAEELNRRIVESTGDCVKILDLDGRLLYMNAAGLRMLEIADASELLQSRAAGASSSGDDSPGGRRGHRAGARTAAAAVPVPDARPRRGVAKWWDAVVTPITDAERHGRPAARHLARHHRAAARRGVPRRAAPGARDDCHRQPAASRCSTASFAWSRASPTACSAPSCCSTKTA